MKKSGNQEPNSNRNYVCPHKQQQLLTSAQKVQHLTQDSKDLLFERKQNSISSYNPTRRYLVVNMTSVAKRNADEVEKIQLYSFTCLFGHAIQKGAILTTKKHLQAAVETILCYIIFDPHFQWPRKERRNSNGSKNDLVKDHTLTQSILPATVADIFIELEMRI